MSTHTYSTVNDGLFPNKLVDIPRFKQEIAASSISVALDTVEIDGENCVVTFKGEATESDVLALEQLVFAHTGEPLASDTRTAIYEQPSLIADSNLYISGHRSVCLAGTTTVLDVQWPEVRSVQGVDIVVKDHEDGDKVSAEVVHPLAGVVLSFGESYVKPDGKISIQARNSKVLPVGLIFRITYHSVGAVNAVMYVDVVTWK